MVKCGALKINVDVTSKPQRRAAKKRQRKEEAASEPQNKAKIKGYRTTTLQSRYSTRMED